ncbi:MAG: LysR substrate-binding domain-containing protein [Phycisphaerales bacterium]
MELTTLRYFRSIARARHMTRAAQSLGVTQPALSAALKKLEAEVGCALLDRTGRGVELTDAGRAFLRHAEESLAAAERGVTAVRELAGLEAGSIRVGGGATVTTYLLPEVVSAVRKQHPGLRFYVRETGSSATAAAVLNGELDLGIVTLPIPSAVSNDLMSIPLVDDELRLIVPKRGIKQTRDRGSELKGEGASGRLPGTFTWKDLVGVPVVAFEAGTAVRQLVDEGAQRAGVTLDVVMELRSIESIKRMVEAGIGVGFVSRFALRPGDGFEQSAASREGTLRRTLAIVRDATGFRVQPWRRSSGNW